MPTQQQRCQSELGMKAVIVLKCAKCNVRIKRGSCDKKMCFGCCKESKLICAIHQEFQRNLEEDERFLDEAIVAKQHRRPQRTFITPESGLTDYHQTVVVWCLKDFCQNKSWSAPTFAALDRAKVSNKLKAKRGRGTFEEDLVKISSFGKKIGRKKRYQQLQSQWTQRATETP